MPTEIEEYTVVGTKYPIKTQKVPSTQVSRVYMTDVGLPEEATEIIDLLLAAEEGDQIILHMTGPGGYLVTTIALIDAIKNSNAAVLAHCSGEVASAFTMLALSCDDVYVAPHTRFMIHNFSGGTYGKGHEIEADFLSLKEQTLGLFREVYIPFLTEEEFEYVIKGGDMYLKPHEVTERFQKILDAEQEDYEKFTAEDNVHTLESMAEHLANNGYTIKKPKK